MGYAYKLRALPILISSSFKSISESEKVMSQLFLRLTGIGGLLAILVLPVIIFALQFRVGFAVPEFAEALAISFWTVFMSSRLI